jgi:hypothetical protein
VPQSEAQSAFAPTALIFTNPRSSASRGGFNDRIFFGAAEMDYTTTRLIVNFWSVGLALIVGSGAVTTLFLSILARFTRVFGLYAGERARLLAQFHNLDRLVEQTRTLTATAETIKARISDEVWDRQMRWGFKRDMYVGLMEALGERIDVESRSKLLEQIRRRDPGNRLYYSERDKLLLRSQEVQSRLVRFACSGPLVISEEAHQILIETTSVIQHVNFDLPDFESTSDHNIAVMHHGLGGLLAAAKKDLGLTLDLRVENGDEEGAHSASA